MRGAVYLWLMVGQVASTLVVQVVPMLTLPVRGYATYSIVYLAFAAGLALQYAAVCDVWARVLRGGEPGEHARRTLRAALTALAVLAGVVVGAVVLAVTGSAALGAAGGAATGIGMFRSSVSYRLVADGRIRRAGLSELTGAAGSGVAATILLVTGAYGTVPALLCWALGALLTAAAAGGVPLVDARATAGGFAARRRDIGLLTAEAAIKTIETVGTPYLVGGIGGALALALHRAASSLTYPVRLVVDVLRAQIVSGAIRGSGRAVLLIGGIGALAGAAVAGGLVLLRAWGLAGDGTIVDAMAPHALAVGAWICTMSVSSFIQFAGRGRFSGRRLIGRRIATTAVVLATTAGGVLLLGTGAVIASAAVAELLAALLWLPRGRAAEGRPAAEGEEAPAPALTPPAR